VVIVVRLDSVVECECQLLLVLRVGDFRGFTASVVVVGASGGAVRVQTLRLSLQDVVLRVLQLGLDPGVVVQRADLNFTQHSFLEVPLVHVCIRQRLRVAI